MYRNQIKDNLVLPYLRFDKLFEYHSRFPKNARARAKNGSPDILAKVNFY